MVTCFLLDCPDSAAASDIVGSEVDRVFHSIEAVFAVSSTRHFMKTEVSGHFYHVGQRSYRHCGEVRGPQRGHRGYGSVGLVIVG